MIDWGYLENLPGVNGNIVKIRCNGETLWERDSLPKGYTQVEWLRADDGVMAYFNLGFAFDTAARIKLTQWIFDAAKTTYPFGAVKSTGERCALSSPYNGSATLYGCDGNTYISAKAGILSSAEGEKNELEMILEKGNLTIINHTTGSTITNQGQAEYTMTEPLFLFAQNYNGSIRFNGPRQIGGEFEYYDKNDKLISHIVTCYRKSDGAPGLYDKVRRMFIGNAGVGQFVIGPEISGGVLTDLEISGRTTLQFTLEDGSIIEKVVVLP